MRAAGKGWGVYRLLVSSSLSFAALSFTFLETDLQS